jgi:hypothetical protein
MMATALFLLSLFVPPVVVLIGAAVVLWPAGRRVYREPVRQLAPPAHQH